jgi:hypothetical protein
MGRQIMEEWRDIPGFEGLYQVSNFGRVKSFHRKKEKILNPSVDNVGYLHISLYRHIKGLHRNVTVHRLVAELFLGKPGEKREVNHIDGNKQNNTSENLEYVMHKDNMIYAWGNGLIRKRSDDKFFFINGKLLSLGKWCKIYNIAYKTVCARLRRGMTLKQALTIPLERKKKKKNPNLNSFAAPARIIFKTR